MMGRVGDALGGRREIRTVFGFPFTGVVVFLLVSTVGANSVGQPIARSNVSEQQSRRFDIPAQPLAPALDAYTSATGLEVIYDSRLAEGRRSTSVDGVLVPDVALRILLEGTGLTVIHGENAFAIAAIPPEHRTGNRNPADRTPYFAILQSSIERAFCRHPETVPGRYRLAVRFGIGSAGEVSRPQLLSSTGDLRRDQVIADLLRGLRIEQSPPPGIPQPVIMIVSPRPPEQTGDCASSEGRLLPAAVR